MPEHLQGPIWWRVLPFPEAAAASGSRAGFPSPSSASYPALRFRRRVDATRMVFPLIRSGAVGALGIGLIQLHQMSVSSSSSSSPTK